MCEKFIEIYAVAKPHSQNPHLQNDDTQKSNSLESTKRQRGFYFLLFPRIITI
ncbi:hypothetical protein [Helicobacter cinaedi]|uniref:hypothetical protein n=1 Tax=Helicobacter cinaedi TaxID=213 RepID=UPI0013151827|nr:hypothetical protein [Helicobacter cinaedi]